MAWLFGQEPGKLGPVGQGALVHRGAHFQQGAQEESH